MKTTLPLRFTLVLLLSTCAMLVHAQSGTNDGTYNFSSLGADNSGGTGFKTQGDKFKVSNIFDQDRKTIYANNANPGDGQTVIIRAEGGSKNKTFTLQDLNIRNFGLTTDLDVFTLTVRNYFGAVIATHVLATNQALGVSAIGISSFNFTPAFPAGGYNNVAEIQVDFHYANASVSPDELTFTSITIANVSSLVPLPLSLLDFSVKKAGNGVRINWTTASEINVDRHLVEHSTDGLHFTTIASFQGQQASSAGAKYSCFHAQPSKGRNYYRLKEVDGDGSEKVFVVKSVDFTQSAITIKSSNPVIGFVVINGLSSGIYDLNLVDANGRSVMTTKVSNVSDYSLALPASLTKGTYWLVVSGQGEFISQQLVKQ